MKKRIFTTLLALVAIALSASAQSKETYAVLSSDGETLTFYYDANSGTFDPEKTFIIPWTGGAYPRWTSYNGNTTIKHVIIDDSFALYQGDFNASRLFYRMEALVDIIGLRNFSNCKITSMYAMFQNCSSLENLDDLRYLNTVNVDDMTYLLYCCKSLSSLDLRPVPGTNGFNTENVTRMEWMFASCIGLTSLNLEGLNTTQVKSMREMFSYCKSLTNLNLTGFNTANVTNMSGMFQQCVAMTNIDLSGFDTGNASSLANMFKGCSSLTTLDLTNFNTGNATRFDSMFEGCSSLTSLNLSNFDTSNVTVFQCMFSDCTSLNTLNLTSFTMPQATVANSMFNGCTNLTTIYCNNNWNNGTLTSVYMFKDCTNLVGAIPYDKNKLDVIYANPDNGYFTTILRIDSIHFPDENFRNWLLKQDYGLDGYLSLNEISRVSSMDVSNLQIANLTGIEHFFALTRLNCRDNLLTTLDMSKNTLLTHFDCANNQLISLNMTGCSPTGDFKCFGNQLAGDYMDEFIDKLPEQSVNNNIPTIAIYNEADNEGNKLTQMQINSILSKGWVLGFFLDNNVNATIAYTDRMPIAAFNFPDANFRNWLLSQSYGADGVLTREETEGTYNFNLYNMNIADLTGVEYFTELTYLYCPNNQLTTIDVSMNVKLRDLICNDNQLTTLNVSNNPNLEHIYCYNNQLTTLDVSSCTSLKRLYCYDNPIRGAGMDNLIEKLPQREWNDGELYVYDVNSTNVSAICTPKHVAAAGQKGWMVYYQNSEYHWELYEGFAAIMGDANGDGSVNIDDAIAVTNYLLGHPDTNFNLTAADVNGDSQVSIADVTAIINQLLLDVIKDRLQKDLKACRAILAQCRDDLERKDNGHEHSDLWSELERLETAVDNLATAVENATTKNELTSCTTDLNSIMSDLAQLEMNIMMAFL